MKPTTTIYSGIRLGKTTADECNVTVNGLILNPKPSQCLRNHSPDGFNWGYGGSGPAQLALAILLDYYQDDEIALNLYQDFKFATVAKIPPDENWRLTGDDIDRVVRRIAEKKVTNAG